MNAATEKKSVGVIGLGAMGMGVAESLLTLRPQWHHTSMC